MEGSMERIDLKYGLNPSQGKAYLSYEGNMPLSVLNGQPGYINILDAMNGWQLVRELDAALGLPAAASFKHVSPAGAAVAVPLSEEERLAYFASRGMSPLAVAYTRARGADRMSSFGDFIALSRVCDADTASVIAKEVSDGIIAPGYEDEALGMLKRKRKGSYVILQIDPGYEPGEDERRTVFGIDLHQDRDEYVPENGIGKIVTKRRDLPADAARDLILSLITLKYTQSNSVCYAFHGQTIGVGAGQQSRLHCTRLAGDKADIWRLRQSGKVLSLPFRHGLTRNEKDNAIIQYLSAEPEIDVIEGWEVYFESRPEPFPRNEQLAYLSSSGGVSLASDAFFPFPDNIIRACRSGVEYIAEPGGSMRDDLVIASADDHDAVMMFTGHRLFHH